MPNIAESLKNKFEKTLHTLKTKGTVLIIANREFIEGKIYDILTSHGRFAPKPPKECSEQMGSEQLDLEPMRSQKEQNAASIAGEVENTEPVIEDVVPEVVSLAPVEQKLSKSERLAGYAHEKLIALEKTANTYKNSREKKIKENIENQVKILARKDTPHSVSTMSNIQDALEYMIVEPEDEDKKKGILAGTHIQRLTFDLKHLEARINWYVETLSNLGVNINTEEIHKDLCMIYKVNTEKSKKGKSPKPIEKNPQEDEENLKLEMRFQDQIKAIVGKPKESKVKKPRTPKSKATSDQK